MSKHKVEIKITGQFVGKGYYVELEGLVIPLREDTPHIFTRTYDQFEISGELDVLIRLKGWRERQWSVEIKVDGQTRLSESGYFPGKGLVTITR